MDKNLFTDKEKAEWILKMSTDILSTLVSKTFDYDYPNLSESSLKNTHFTEDIIERFSDSKIHKYVIDLCAKVVITAEDYVINLSDTKNEDLPMMN